MHAPDWSELQHAYGPAGDVPGLLEHARSAAAPSGYREEPWFSLWSALCHQGDVFTASYAAVPELVALAEARAAEPAVARECLLLAGCIELERALPEGRKPPAVPATFTSVYSAALRRGATLAAAQLAGESDPESQRALALSHAALRGDAVEARRLADPPEEQGE